MSKIIFLITLLVVGCGEADSWQNTNTGNCLEKVCVEGHVYYQNCGPCNGGMAIQLDDEGKPIKCEVGYEKSNIR